MNPKTKWGCEVLHFIADINQYRGFIVATIHSLSLSLKKQH